MEMGYKGFAVELEALDYSSPVPRDRLWWLFFKLLRADNTLIEHVFWGFLSSFRLGPDHGDYLSRCITLDDNKRRAEATAMGFPMHEDLGQRQSKRGKADPEYKVLHYECFSGLGIDWPPCLSDFPYISFAGMRVRETEAAILMCELFEFPAGAKFQFLDLNVDVKRLLEHCWDHEKGYPKMKQGPWHSKPPTLVGSMKLFFRYHDTNAPKGFRVRSADGFEHFRLQGWDDSMV